MPRVFSEGESINPGGWSRRQAAARAIAAEKEAKRNDPAMIAVAAERRGMYETNRLRAVVETAKAHRDGLITKLTHAKALAERMAEKAYRKGVIHDDSPRVQAQVQGLPALIDRAEDEIATAQADLDRHLAAQITATPVTPKKGRPQ